jgi:serine/threonine protein kinase
LTVEHVAGYSHLEPVGQGRFGVVYRAEQPQLARIVALKVLLVDAMDGLRWEGFRQESAPTGHPNIVPVLETGTTGSGRPYIAMEYCERGSLGDLVAREGPLPVGAVLQVGVKIAGALAAAHEFGIVHREVTPRNILVLRSGEPALADFGLAALVGRQSSRAARSLARPTTRLRRSSRASHRRRLRTSTRSAPPSMSYSQANPPTDSRQRAATARTCCTPSAGSRRTSPASTSGGP